VTAPMHDHGVTFSATRCNEERSYRCADDEHAKCSGVISMRTTGASPGAITLRPCGCWVRGCACRSRSTEDRQALVEDAAATVVARWERDNASAD
jgi:hypothetical protein